MAKRKTLEFLQLTSAIPYPPAVKGELSTVHSTFIDQVIKEFDNTKSCKTKIIHAFNCISYMYMSGDSKPLTWDVQDPWHTFTEEADDVLEEALGQCYINMKDVDWVDVPIITSSESVTTESEVEPKSKPQKGWSNIKKVPATDPVRITPSTSPLSPFEATDKADLYIQPPLVPRFDTTTAFAAGIIDSTSFAVYRSYPEVPTKQNEISATTDVNMMTEKDLLKLYPNTFIRTRAECMYYPCERIELHPQLGLILPIGGFTREQIIDNIIKYPHLFRLQKEVDGNVESFYSTIEIDGELHKTLDYWRQLPESMVIPYSKEFIKEYVVRRYLLERDIKKIEHRYKMYGTLDPFLTLFTTSGEYSRMGYKDAVKLAHDCVEARVSYKKSRNPVLRRLAEQNV